MLAHKATIIVGLGYGDEGKGSMVDYLCRVAESPVMVVRFNGGGQAAHNVVLPDGTHHTFSLFGSGTFAGAYTHLSRYVLVNPLAMAKEALILKEKLGGKDPFEWTTVSPHCPVVTPYHVEANRCRETIRRDKRHGSCGVGIGETMMDVEKHQNLTMGLLRDQDALQMIEELHDRKIREFPQIEKFTPTASQLYSAYETILPKIKLCDDWAALQRTNNLVFEGAQGVMIDEKYGAAPYHTWSNCTFDNALTLLKKTHYQYEVERIGVIRTFATRHGVGPMPTEMDELDWLIEDDHNKTGDWQGPFRVGNFDVDSLRYAIDSCRGIDGIALTHIDMLYNPFQMRQVDVPVLYDSYGPTWKDKRKNE